MKVTKQTTTFIIDSEKLYTECIYLDVNYELQNFSMTGGRVDMNGTSYEIDEFEKIYESIEMIKTAVDTAALELNLYPKENTQP